MYHTTFCPKCGHEFSADKAAFDFDRVVHDAIAKNKSSRWKDLLKINLGLYLTKTDLDAFFDVIFDLDGDLSQRGIFSLTVGSLKRWITYIYSADDIGNSRIDFDELYNQVSGGAASSNDVNALARILYIINNDALELNAEKVRKIIGPLIKKLGGSENSEIICEAAITMRINHDDNGDEYPSSFEVCFIDNNQAKEAERVINEALGGDETEADDRAVEDRFERFESEASLKLEKMLCPFCGCDQGEQSGKFREVIFSLVGSSRVGKTAYITALVNELLEHTLDKVSKNSPLIFFPDNEDKNYLDFVSRYVEPYREGKRVEKTIISKGDVYDIPLLSLHLCVNGLDIVTTIVDMPGEAFAESGDDDFVINSRNIFNKSHMMWICLDPAQIDPNTGFETVGRDGVTIDIIKIIENFNGFFETNRSESQKNAAVLITKSDTLEEAGMYFPDENVVSKYFGKGALKLKGLDEIMNNSYRMIENNEMLRSGLEEWCGSYSVFPISSYSKSPEAMGNDEQDTLEKKNSLVLIPLLWSLCTLGLAKAVKTVEVRKEVKKQLFKKNVPAVTEYKDVICSEKELFTIRK